MAHLHRIPTDQFKHKDTTKIQLVIVNATIHERIKDAIK